MQHLLNRTKFTGFFKHFASITFLMFALTIANGQQALHLDDAPKKAVKAFEKGQEAIRANELAEAEQLFLQAVEISPDFVDPYLYIGDLNTERGNWPAAANAYQQALKLDPYWKIGTYYRLARVLGPLEDFEAAAKALEVYLSSEKVRGEGRARAQRLLANMRFAKDAKENALPFSPVNLGPNINTPDLEYLPSLSADENILVYTIRLDGRNEDFFFSKRDEEGNWRPSENMGPPINTEYNEGAEHLSADGRMLFYTACNLPQGMGSCDIYFSEKIDGRWTKPRNAGPGVNGKSWDTQPCLSADGSRLYFVSNRGGGQGDMDIWMSRRLENGEFDVATNLGPAVNTPNKEQTPFIHPDGSTLYFSSDGHPGMGETDLYLSRVSIDGKWQVPLNLGYPINTTSNEGSLVVSTDGQTGYFASDRFDGYGGLDLYSFEMPKVLQPEPVTYVRAVVKDAATKQPLSATIEWQTVELKRVAGTYKTSPLYKSTTDEKGEFLICLPSGAAYTVLTNREDYFHHSQHFILDSGISYAPYEVEILLEPVRKGVEITLRNLFFDPGNSRIMPFSKPELDKLVELLLQNEELRIRINGHTDDRGSDEYNMDLSERRAGNVMKLLIEQGIDASRLESRGYGESKPVVPNDSDENRAINRRTTFEIL